MLLFTTDAVLKVREVFPGSSHVLGMQVDNNYISLPGELFENLNESGIELSTLYKELHVHYLSLQNLWHLSTLKTYHICFRAESKNNCCQN